MLSEESRKSLEDIIAKNMRAVFDDPKAYEGLKQKAASDQQRPYQVPAIVEEKARLTIWEAPDGTMLCTASPKEAAGELTNVHVVYYHGGGFLMRIDELQWGFCLKLVSELGLSLTVPIYPLCPSSNSDETYSSAFASYRAVLAKYPESKIVLMGDSAGGNLAIGMAQVALDKDVAQPAGIVVMSPFVDMDGSVYERNQPDTDDPMLSWYGCNRILEDWAGGVSRVHPPDPLYGPLEGLAPLEIVVGTSEILLQGSREIVKLARDAGVDASIHEFEGMWHVFPLRINLPEAQEAFRIISRALRRFAE